MSIMSDRWIKQQCLPPTHIHEKLNGIPDYVSAPFSRRQQNVEASTQTNALMKSYTATIVPSYPETPYDSDPIRLPEVFQETLRSITQAELAAWKPMIEPFFPESINRVGGHQAPSFGVSSYGYDVRLSRDELKIFSNINHGLIDPCKLTQDCYQVAEVRRDENDREYVILPPNSFLLGHTIEYLRIPRDILTIVLGKSTWARCGVSVLATPLEPGWEGQVVLEFANTTSLPQKFYVEVGVAQFLFLQGEECDTTYDQRNNGQGGKYQGQTGLTLPKM